MWHKRGDCFRGQGRSTLRTVRETSDRARHGGMGLFSSPHNTLWWEESRSIAVLSPSSPGLPAVSMALGAAPGSECLCTGCRVRETGHGVDQESRSSTVLCFESRAGSGQGCPGGDLLVFRSHPTIPFHSKHRQRDCHRRSWYLASRVKVSSRQHLPLQPSARADRPWKGWEVQPLGASQGRV